MLANGDYVRLKMAPAHRMGTIDDIKTERCRVEYLFRQDKRFLEAVQGFVFEAWVPEEQLEPCARPSDQQVDTINKLIKIGS